MPRTNSSTPSKQPAHAQRLLMGAAVMAMAQAVTAQASAPPVYSTVPISPSANVQNAGSISNVLLPSFVAFSIEPSNLFAYTGANASNPLTLQLMQNLRNFTGVPPHWRAGGNSGDNFWYNTSITQPKVVDNPTKTNATNQWYIGPGYFTALDNLLDGTPVTIQLNLADNSDSAVDRNVEHARAALTLPKNVSVVSLEIGNEPDRYVGMGYRPSGWTENPGYGAEWLSRAQAIKDQVLTPLNLSEKAFEPGTVANPFSKAGSAFQVQWIAFDGQGPAASNLNYVLAFNEHDYLFWHGATEGELTQDWLLNMNNTYDQFSGWANEASAAVSRKRPYHLGEVGSIGPDGTWGISDSFANTLWTFNFLLYTASRSVDRVTFHMTQTGSGAPWQPISIEGHGNPHVRSPFYAIAAMDQIIGGACDVRIASVPVINAQIHSETGEEAGNDRQAAYTIYSQNTIKGFAFINSMQSNASSPRNGFVNYTFTLPDLAHKSLYLSYLSAPGTDSLENTTWNGMQYDPSTGFPGPAPALNQDWVQVVLANDSGFVAVPVPDGSAVVATVGSRLGSNLSVYPEACAPYQERIPPANLSVPILVPWYLIVLMSVMTTLMLV